MLWRLPDELLLDVAKYVSVDEDEDSYRPRFIADPYTFAPLTPTTPDTDIIDLGDGKRHLLDFSRTDRRTRAIVLELFVEPKVSVQLRKIPSLIRMYLRYPDLAAKTRSLKIKPSAFRYFARSTEWERDNLHFEAFVQACESTLCNDPTKFLDPYDKSLRVFDFRAGHINPLLYVLLSLLPNLECFRIKNLPLHHFAFLNCLFDAQEGCSATWWQPPWWRGTYVERMFRLLIPQLQELELPKYWTTQDDEYTGELKGTRPNQIPVCSFLPFTSLRRLVIPEGALFDTNEGQPFSGDICAMFPPTLESLSIRHIDFRRAFPTGEHRVLDLLRTLFTRMFDSRAEHFAHLAQAQHLDAIGLSSSAHKSQSIPRRSRQWPPEFRLFPALRDIYIHYHPTMTMLFAQETLNEWARVELIQVQLQQSGATMGVDLDFSFPWVGDPFDDDYEGNRWGSPEPLDIIYHETMYGYLDRTTKKKNKIWSR